MAETTETENVAWTTLDQPARLEKARKLEQAGAKIFWDVQRYDAAKKACGLDRVYGFEFDELEFGRKHGGGDYRRQLRVVGDNGVKVNIDFSIDARAVEAAAPAQKPAPSEPAALLGVVEALANQVRQLATTVQQIQQQPAPRAADTGGLTLADVLKIIEVRSPPPPASDMAAVVTQVATAMQAMNAMMPKPQPITETLAMLKEFRNAAREIEPAGARGDDGESFTALLPMAREFFASMQNQRQQPAAPAPAPVRMVPVRMPLPAPRQAEEPAPAAAGSPEPAAAAPAPTPPTTPPPRVRLPFPAADTFAEFLRSIAPQIDAAQTAGTVQQFIPQVAALLADHIDDAGGDSLAVAEDPESITDFIEFAPDLEPRRVLIAAVFSHVLELHAAAEKEHAE